MYQAVHKLNDQPLPAEARKLIHSFRFAAEDMQNALHSSNGDIDSRLSKFDTLLPEFHEDISETIHAVGVGREHTAVVSSLIELRCALDQFDTAVRTFRRQRSGVDERVSIDPADTAAIIDNWNRFETDIDLAMSYISPGDFFHEESVQEEYLTSKARMLDSLDCFLVEASELG